MRFSSLLFCIGKNQWNKSEHINSILVQILWLNQYIGAHCWEQSILNNTRQYWINIVSQVKALITLQVSILILINIDTKLERYPTLYETSLKRSIFAWLTLEGEGEGSWRHRKSKITFYASYFHVFPLTTYTYNKSY